jgi:nucleoside-diphosphate kinase
MERTLLLLKPDAVQRGLMGALISRFEATGLHFVALKMVAATREQAAAHYAEHEGKPFLEDVLSLLTEAPLVACVVQGRGAVAICRKLRGPTNPADAPPGTICGDYAHYLYKGRNLLHASSDEESAKREIELWLDASEIHSYERYDAPATIGTREF